MARRHIQEIKSRELKPTIGNGRNGPSPTDIADHIQESLFICATDDVSGNGRLGQTPTGMVTEMNPDRTFMRNENDQRSQKNQPGY